MRFSARRHERRRLLTRSDGVLDDLSVQEIDERITTLQAEITRLEEARRAKQTSLSAATAFFKFDKSRALLAHRRRELLRIRAQAAG